MNDLYYRPVCHEDGRFLPWVNGLGKQSGAYIIRHSETHEVLYVGESHTGRLAATLKRHFSTWHDTKERKHFTYRRRGVEVAVRTTPPQSAQGAQNNLIGRLHPRDNTQGQPF
jgi:excinuclease UvrABC nuclease subunit